MHIYSDYTTGLKSVDEKLCIDYRTNILSIYVYGSVKFSKQHAWIISLYITIFKLKFLLSSVEVIPYQLLLRQLLESIYKHKTNITE